MSKIKFLLGDCVERMAEMEEGSIGGILTDPPYGLEFMGKDWDRLGWEDGGGMSKPGIGDRKIPWPSYSGTGPAGTANATCKTCGGRMRGENKCSCESPDWRVKGKPLKRNSHAERMQLQQAWHERWLREAYRVLKPGAIIKVMGGTRTFHRLAAAMEIVGFKLVNPMEEWVYGSGFPKSLNIYKKLKKMGHPDADQYKGYGTALKPAWEPVVVGRKPA